jgi:hypothetical protein
MMATTTTTPTMPNFPRVDDVTTSFGTRLPLVRTTETLSGSRMMGGPLDGRSSRISAKLAYVDMVGRDN